VLHKCKQLHRVVHHAVARCQDSQDRAWPSWPVKTKSFQRFHCTRGGPRTCKRDGVPQKRNHGEENAVGQAQRFVACPPNHMHSEWTSAIHAAQIMMQSCKVLHHQMHCWVIRVATRRTFVRAPGSGAFHSPLKHMLGGADDATGLQGVFGGELASRPLSGSRLSQAHQQCTTRFACLSMK
jgi:hypothetical protein